MTSTLPRSSLRPPAEPERPARLVAVGAGAAVRAALLGLFLCALACWLAWWAEDRSGNDLADVARVAGQLWLVAHGTPLQLAEGRLDLTPLGLVLLPLLLTRGAGRRVRRRTGASGWPVVGAVAVPYATLAGLVAAGAGTASLRPVPLVAALAAGLVAAGGAALGVRSDPRAPAPVRRPVVAGGVAATAALMAAGALLAAVALVLDGGTAAELAGSSEPGAVGGLALALLGAALVPNAVIWSVSWLAGPGFAVGVGTVVTPSTTLLGPVPGLPLAAALPGGPPPGWAAVALLVPVAAGVVGARVAVSRGAGPGAGGRLARLRGAVLLGAGVGAVAAAGVGVLALVSGGALGGGHLAAVGPSAWKVALAVGGEVALGAALVAARAPRRG